MVLGVVKALGMVVTVGAAAAVVLETPLRGPPATAAVEAATVTAPEAAAEWDRLKAG